jgi:hypothetical protein
VVEQVEDEGFDLNLIQVREEHVDAFNKQVDCELLVLLIAMLLPVLLVNLVKEQAWSVYNLKHLLDDLPLEFEARHMSVVCHHCQDVLYYQHVEVLIED